MRTIACLLLPALTLPAQGPVGFVSPAHFAAVEGTGNTALPFGQGPLPFRFLQVHDGVAAMNVTGIAFRHDTNNTGTVRPAFTLTVDLWMSTAAVAAAGAVTTFDTNHGGDKLQVVVNRTVNVPANDPAQLPGAFGLDIPFEPNVVFPFAGGSLCWEVHVTASTNTTGIVPFDAVLTQGPTPASPGLLGTRAHTGCVSTGQTLPMQIVPASSPVDWAAGIATQAVNAMRLQPNGVFVWVNGTNTTSWSGAPLPFVVPTSTGAPSGTCTLYTDLTLLAAGIASPTGTAQLVQQFAVTPALHGVLLPVQAVGLDAAANPFGFTASNLVVQQLAAPYPAAIGIRRVYAAGGLPATGTVDGNSPLITLLR